MGAERIQPERIRVEKAASILGISSRTVQAMALRGELPGAAKIGGSWTFCESALRKWIEERTEKPRPARYSNPNNDYKSLSERRIEKAYQEALGRFRRLGRDR
ncbi:helix-turn-helix domain-containing protein [Xanthobacter sp. KR7-65]|uniref:helix-turn-helix domain-containing protein n=1 Tax=Xanthobacter sp. KR7-65 TaxID=3156612 RepID=UPI0032B5AAAF